MPEPTAAAVLPGPSRRWSRLAGGGVGATLLRGVAGGGGVRMLGMALSFLVGLQLARGLGPEGYGVYALAMSVVAILGVPAQFGVPQLVTREVAAGHAGEDWPLVRGVLRWADRTVLVSSVAVVAAALGWLLVTGEAAEGPFARTLWVAVLLTPVIALTRVREAAVKGLMHLVVGQVPDLIVRPGVQAALLAGVWLFAFPLTPASAMGVHLAAAVASLAVAWWLLRGRRPRELQAAHAAVGGGGAWLRASVPMGLTIGLFTLQSHAAILLLGVFSDESQVGLYQVANRVAAFGALPMGLVSTVVGPVMAKLYAAGDHTKLARTSQSMAWAMLGGAGLLLLPLVVLGRPLLSLAFGAEYAAAAAPLAVLALNHLIVAFCGPSATLLNMIRLEREVTKAFLWALPLSVAAAIVLVPRLGATGAAWALVVSTLVWNGLVWRSSRRLGGIDPSVIGPLLPTPRPRKADPSPANSAPEATE